MSAARDDTALIEALPARVYAVGISLRKRGYVRRFAAEARVRFVRTVQAVPDGAVLLLWGSQPLPADVLARVQAVRLEDGFLRSVGLGSDLTQPLSWVLDRRGLYYDATRPSDLEHLLQNASFAQPLRARAARLRERIVASRITKYNVGAGAWQRPALAARVILVPGQVERDASLKFGAPRIATNMALLQAVREANPDAWIVYKPHPDVVAGLRAGGDGEALAAQFCNDIVLDVGMDALLPLVDEVHLMTSLTGFEALLRGKKVTCYGLPFYAGWGLTTDIIPLARRTRALCLDELVAAALILYPRYVSRTTAGLISPEQALDELLAWRGIEATGWTTLWRSVLRQVLCIWRADK
ncbi:MAG: beta-3-deoxy-D-manno-oct-2-ulosonic acid transferase [Pseudomonadota bacterium]